MVLIDFDFCRKVYLNKPRLLSLARKQCALHIWCAWCCSGGMHRPVSSKTFTGHSHSRPHLPKASHCSMGVFYHSVSFGMLWKAKACILILQKKCASLSNALSNLVLFKHRKWICLGFVGNRLSTTNYLWYDWHRLTIVGRCGIGIKMGKLIQFVSFCRKLCNNPS